jgi:hypothetical protein
LVLFLSLNIRLFGIYLGLQVIFKFFFFFFFFFFLIVFFHEESCGLTLDSDCAIIRSSYNNLFIFNKSNEYGIGNNTTIDVELDAYSQTLFVFINHKPCPCYVRNIKASSFPLLFAVRGFDCACVVEVASVCRLRNPSFSAASVCRLLCPSSSPVSVCRLLSPSISPVSPLPLHVVDWEDRD